DTTAAAAVSMEAFASAEDIAKVMGASLARIKTSELQSLRVRVVLGSHPTRKSLVVFAGRAIQVSAGAVYEVVTTFETWTLKIQLPKTFTQC
ncbi:hypothetical protein HAX54_036843, partial [Datura stramonium]|nr:hypothetical protein [Datura stramonium]